MKKILLMILPMLLLFGVGFADTFTMWPTFTVVDNTSLSSSSSLFVIMWNTWITLYSIQQWNHALANCDLWNLKTSDWTSLASWSYNSITWVTIVDTYLSPWVYRIVSTLSWGWYCSVPRQRNAVWYYSWFFMQYASSTNDTSYNLTYYAYWIVSRVFSWIDPTISAPPAPPTPYTITSPLWVQNIEQNITLTWDVNYDSWYPDFIISSMPSAWSTVYRDWFLFNYTWLTFNITDVDNVLESWWILEIYSNTSAPVANVFLTGLVVSWSFDSFTGNVFQNFSENIITLFVSNIPAILIAVAIFLAIFFLIRIIKPRKKRLPF